MLRSHTRNRSSGGSAGSVFDFSQVSVPAGFTFSRASSKRYVGSNGYIQVAGNNVKPVCYDPTTLTLLGFNKEGAGTNICLQSETFTNATWTKTDITPTAASTLSPDNTTGGTLITEGSAGTAVLSQAITTVTNTLYTFSLWVKRGNTDWLRLFITDGTNTVNQWVNVSTGALGTKSTSGTVSNTDATIEAFRDSWYRVSVTGQYSGTATNVSIHSASADASTTRVNGATYYVWGAQHEQNYLSTSYIPTTSGSATRAIETLSGPVSSLTRFNNTSGTALLYCTNAKTFSSSFHQRGIGFEGSAGYNMNLYRNYFYSGRWNFSGSDNFAGQWDLLQAAAGTGGNANGALTRCVVSWEANNIAFSQDGQAPSTDNSATVPTVSTLIIGGDTTDHHYGYIREIRIY